MRNFSSFFFKHLGVLGVIAGAGIAISLFSSGIGLPYAIVIGCALALIIVSTKWWGPRFLSWYQNRIAQEQSSDINQKPQDPTKKSTEINHDTTALTPSNTSQNDNRSSSPNSNSSVEESLFINNFIDTNDPCGNKTPLFRIISFLDEKSLLSLSEASKKIRNVTRYYLKKRGAPLPNDITIKSAVFSSDSYKTEISYLLCENGDLLKISSCTTEDQPSTKTFSMKRFRLPNREKINHIDFTRHDIGKIDCLSEKGHHYIIDLANNKTHSPYPNIAFGQLLTRSSNNPNFLMFNAYFALSKDQVFTWGKNDNNNILLANNMRIDPNEPTKTTVKGIMKLLLVETTYNHSPRACILGLTHQKKVISWGSGSRGCLGRDDWENNKTPTEISFPKENASIENIYASSGSIYAIDGDGSLFAWGANDGGQLSINSSQDHFDPPIAVPFFHNNSISIDKMFLCDNSYLILAKDRSGNHYMWGSYFDAYSTKRVTIEKINFDQKPTIKTIIRSQDNFFAIDQNDAVYSWGEVKKALLGRVPTNRETVFEKQPSKIFFDNKALCAKKIFIYEHRLYTDPHRVFVLGRDGKVYAWGNLINQQKKILMPIQIQFSDNKNPKITFIDTMMLIAYVTPTEAYQFNQDTLQFDPLFKTSPINNKDTDSITGRPSSSGKFKHNNMETRSSDDDLATSLTNLNQN